MEDLTDEAYKEFTQQILEKKPLSLLDYLKEKESILRGYVILQNLPKSMPCNLNNIFMETLQAIKNKEKTTFELELCSKGFLNLAQYAVNMIQNPKMFKGIPIKKRSTTFIYYIKKIGRYEDILKELNYEHQHEKFTYIESEMKPMHQNDIRELAFNLLLCSIKCDLMATFMQLASKRLKNTGEPYCMSWIACNKLIIQDERDKQSRGVWVTKEGETGV